jgi:CRP-like cAMP-binding protein
MLGRIRGSVGESLAAFRDVFANPDLRRLELAWTATQLGRFAYFIAIAVYAFDAGGATAVGVVAVIRLLPSALAAPFTSILGDRYPRKRVMFVTNLAQAATIGAAGIVILGDGPSAVVYTLVALNAVVVTAFRPAQAALVPSLARTPAELTAANVTASTIESLGLFVGPAIGGLLLAATSTGVVFLATAATALVSALLVARISAEPARERAPAREGRLKTAFAGFGTVVTHPSLRVLEGLMAAQTLVAGAFNVLVVVAALELLDVGSGGLGALNSAVGIGGLAGAVVAALLVGYGRVSKQFALGMLLWGVPIALIGVWPNAAFAFALLLLVGIGNTVVDVTDLTLLQRAVPDDVLARVFGAVNSITTGALAVGSMLAPLLISGIGIRWALVVTGALLPVLTAVLFRRLAALDRGAVVAKSELDLLRANDIFAPLPQATVELLAGRLTPVQTAAGEVIFRQGDHGDRYYLVGEGRVDVTIDGRHTRALGPGEGFGEIALLRDVPRTATVTAATPVDLYALERDDFLTAVGAHAESADRAEAMIASRVGALRPSELEAV